LGESGGSSTIAEVVLGGKMCTMLGEADSSRKHVDKPQNPSLLVLQERAGGRQYIRGSPRKATQTAGCVVCKAFAGRIRAKG
jgi:hypothetical protein